MTEEYSSRSFFDATDNHAALSGLVLRFQQAITKRFGPGRNRYMAGLWELDIVRGLLWASRRVMRGDCPPLQEPERKGQRIRRAPSWSWMSLVGPVSQCIHGAMYTNRLSYGEPRCTPASPDGQTWSPHPDAWGPLLIKRADFPSVFRLEIKAYLREGRISLVQGSQWPANVPDRPILGDWGFTAIESDRQARRDQVFLEALETEPLSKVDGDKDIDRKQCFQIVGKGAFDCDYGKGGSMKTWAVRITTRYGLLLERVRLINNGPALFAFKRVGIFAINPNSTFYPLDALEIKTRKAGRNEHVDVIVNENRVPLETVVLV